MHYIFDVKDAEQYGLEESIMLYNIKYWITLNKANNTNFNDGRTWTYNSVSAFKKLFPFWSERQIGRILKSLIDKHILITGNYNKISYDRTLWYAFSDEYILLNGEMENTESSNRIIQNVTPIPDSNTDKKTNSIGKSKKKEISPSTNESFNLFWLTYDYKKDKIKCMDAWCKLDEDIHKVINNHVKEYIKSTPDKAWRKTSLYYPTSLL